jgi:APA family basic amino acid/polyamine antiporter
VGLNFIFLKVAPYNDLVVKFTNQGPINIDTGNVAGKYMFGVSGVKIVGLVISLLLVSSISAMIMAGPRVIAAIGKDFSIFSVFAKTNTGGSPVLAIWVLSAIAILLLFTGTFNQILEFTSFVLILFSTLTVSGLIYSRYKYPMAKRPFKTPLYPFLPLIFIFCNIWFMYQAILHNPLNTLIGGLIVVSGIPVFYISKGNSKTINTK